MALPPTSASLYADPSGLASLKKSAGERDPKALRETARQFESLFTQMMLKSMRDASKSFSSEKSLMENDQTEFYRDMFDSQLAVQMSKGKGIGLSDMLVKQLQAKGVAAASDVATKSRVSVDPKSGASGFETRDSRVGRQQDSLALPQSKSNAAVSSQPARSNSASTVKEDIAAKFASLVTQSAPSGISGPRDGGVIVDESDSGPALTNLESRISNLESSSRRASRVSRPDASPQPLATSPADFIDQLWPHAQAAGKELGVDPRTLIAHAALETGWGKNVPCNPDGSCSNNLFGIKASGKWRGASVGVTTVEYQDGVAVKQRASFRAYDSPADSFRDYATMIKNSPRYAAALGSGNDAAAFANALQQGGYATDPNYATKLAAVADRLGVTLKAEVDRPLPTGRSVSSGEET